MWFRSNKNMRWFAIDEIDREKILVDVMQMVKESVPGNA